MDSSNSSKLQVLLSQWQRHDGIPLSTVFSPQNIPPFLGKDQFFTSEVAHTLESKLTECAPSHRRMAFLREIDYLGCFSGGVAFFTKKEPPSFEPCQINVHSTISHLKMIRFSYTNEASKTELYLAIVTDQEMHCYEAQAKEEGEYHFQPMFSVENPVDGQLTCVSSTQSGRVFCGTEFGDIFELRNEVKGAQPFWQCLLEADSTQVAVKSITLDETNRLVYVLYEDSTIEVFAHRHFTEPSRRVTSFPSNGDTKIVELFPMPDRQSTAASLLAVGSYGELLNFELDLRLVKNAFSFLKKLLRSSSRSRSGHLIMESRGLEACLESEEGEGVTISTVGYFDGLVMAIPVSEDGSHVAELYTVSRLPAESDDDHRPANGIMCKEPMRIDGDYVSMHLAAEDANSELFHGLELGSDELARQLFLKGQKFVILCGSKVINLRKRCPVEILMEIMQLGDPTALREFFQLYGSLETATMAIQLAAARGDDHAKRLILEHPSIDATRFAELDDSRELSVSARAMLNYFRRLVAPIWTRTLFRLQFAGSFGKDAKMKCTLSLSLLEWFAVSLGELEGLIEWYAASLDAIRFHDGSVFAPKCKPLLEEFELIFSLKDVVIKCKEILNLFRIFEESKPVILKENQLKRFEKLTLEELVFKIEVPTAPLQELIKAILEDKNSEVQEAIVFRMDDELPVLSHRKDRLYNKALDLLMKARTSPRIERQEELVKEAMTLVGDQCEEEHLDEIVNSLANLNRHYEVLYFVSKTTKRLVPDIAEANDEVKAREMFLRRKCYNRAFSYVADYIEKINPEEDDATDITILHRAVKCLDDAHLMDMMLEKLLTSKKVAKKALHKPEFFEFCSELKHYIEKRVKTIMGDQQLPTFAHREIPSQAEHDIRMLVEICQTMGDMKEAGDWLIFLSKRISPKKKPVPLISRIGDLNDARAMYENVMSTEFLNNLETAIQVAMFQQRLVTKGKRTFIIMDDVADSSEITKDLLAGLRTTDSLLAFIRNNFSAKVAKDLMEELNRITGGESIGSPLHSGSTSNMES